MSAADATGSAVSGCGADDVCYGYWVGTSKDDEGLWAFKVERQKSINRRASMRWRVLVDYMQVCIGMFIGICWGEEWTC
jgi:hypothetical protein